MESLIEYLPRSVKGKRILITGGTTGIGRAAAILLAAQGARIIIFGRNQEPIEQTIAAISALETKTECVGISADVAEQKDIDRVFQLVDSHFAGLDILINNAALPFESIIDGNYQDWQYVINTNLLGYMACAHEAIKRMKGNLGSHIVNIGSISADERGKNSSVYVASKAGIQGFNESLRKEVNELGIKVSLIEPGLVGSDMVKEDSMDQT
ncbi:SDR family oxidoreductase [Pedobacter gandavensis]|uniref:SDR family oxidoreductase n=1 Tax=Pedobacter gandavensis TaxID=2679963 RepID=UPI00247A44B0|nr:SDR family oxidoreductase [Pedobacter gandavensis]WGQ10672.1 SDR family oxidoreductase [Pedobacter gandavensis]